MGSLLLTVPAASAFAQSPSAVTVMNPAVNLRVDLDNLLGAHAILAQLAMQAGYSGSPQFVYLAAALNKNTEHLTAAVASVYGAKAGAAFNKLWSGHIQDFVDYVVATKTHNTAGQQAALAALAQYKTQFAGFMAQANPNIDATTLANALGVHVDQLIATFNAYVAGDYTTSVQDFVQAYEHMFMSGDYLSAAIVKQYPAKFGNDSSTSPAANLRVALDELLGLHATLAQWAMADGYKGAPDFNAVVSALQADTGALTQAITSIYGKAGGAMFDKLWSGHIQDFVNYVVATKKGDAAGQQAALAALATYGVQFSDFLASANPNFSTAILQHALQVHVQQLIATFKANIDGSSDYYVQPDFITAYNHMFMAGGYLAASIIKQMPTKFPVQ